ncbi:putative Ig domain-containing protein [Serratia quinivorans]|uniref:putative Ig domain-containing protein n=1 Tax=Serratia quinivorans TaxID=137545 RepID=UPI0021BD6923|nr:putative Ig domain-containing protein [Serratia quinivorans]
MASLNDATVGTAYSATAVATPTPADDGTYTYAWSISGTGAAGLAINATSGAISGTPTEAGSATVTCKITDSFSNEVSGTATLTVKSSA